MQANPTEIVGYLLLFMAAAFVFIFAALLVGRLVRPKVPVPRKAEIYECGEPTVGPGFVQFDLRFYVVALLFIIFDVEAAFFFPWAVVFGKAARLSDPAAAAAVAQDLVAGSAAGPGGPIGRSAEQLAELGMDRLELPRPAAGVEENAAAVQEGFRKLALAAMADVAVFFGVLLVGFAYVWKKGDLDWVRALGRPPQETIRTEANAVTAP
jgi:NADH-quinone oxidoreductase subunit A